MSLLWLFFAFVAGNLCNAAALYGLVHHLGKTPEGACQAIGACLRGFSQRAGRLSVVLQVGGRRVQVPFLQIAEAIERCQVTTLPPLPSSPPTSERELN